MWVIEQEWDEPISSEFVYGVLQLLTEFPNIRIPTFVKNTQKDNQLLIFCDASTKAYAAVLYLRIRKTNFTNLLFLKVRLVAVGKRKKIRSKHFNVP